SFYHDCQCCTCTERLCMQSLYGADFGDHPAVHSFPTRRSSDLSGEAFLAAQPLEDCSCIILDVRMGDLSGPEVFDRLLAQEVRRSEEHTSELQSRENLVCGRLLEKKKQAKRDIA